MASFTGPELPHPHVAPSDGGVAAVSLRFDAAEKRLVRAGADDAGDG